ncbi:YkgJ family cysteine cluster protein [Nanoarchaeota archaeon]
MALITCDNCDGRCCRTFALHLQTPRTKEDYLDIKWILLHKPVKVYIDNEDDWLAMLDIPCSKLDLKTGACTDYENRPPMCRKSDLKDCEMNVKEMKVVFNNVKEYEKWLEENGKI